MARTNRLAGALVSAGALAVCLTGVPAAGAQTVEPQATENLCPITQPLTEAENSPHQQVSLIRSYMGCRTSDDPGPPDPGGQ